MSITLTEKALEKIREIKKDSEIATDVPLRIGVMGGGCVGFKYNAFFEEDPIQETDTVFEFEEQKVVIDMMSLEYLQETSVDYQDNGLVGAGFKFNSNRVKRTCGCGQSFST